MDIAAFASLLTPPGQAVLAEAAGSDLSENGLITTASRLRERHPADLVAAALTQVRLRERARAKFGRDAARMYFTPAGLEQSTRASVAAYRARRFASFASTEPTLELGCGIGGDLIARARAGVPGMGVELDPLTAAVARANVDAFGLGESASVREGDATREDPGGYGTVFADPGRRTARGRVFDPRSYEPPLDTVLEIAGRAGGACVKVAPGIPHEAVPDGAEAEWISVGGEVKEAALWLGGLAGNVRRRATLITEGDRGGAGAAGTDVAEPGGAGAWVETLTPEPGLGDPAVREWGRYLYEPDGAVIRAHLVAEVAARVNGGLADPKIAYVTSDELVPTPFAAAYEIEDVLGFSLKRLKAELRRREVGVLTVKKRGSAVDVDRLRRDLGFARKAPRGAKEMTLVLTRVGTAPIALLTRPADHRALNQSQ
ncbi:THUMP-like domain-containing protein [Actinomadura rudentiformis]|uniref:SAM-dependent methyltransferase n=1 Tax=Actinomadura rudentiformis TaxID=359158 RepID=A0A6H9YTS7_9ACTN|nr:SAM-dependent methyltransferase [Actinomadura rudentiformis]KAB2351770.1 SAM-dependent methyltransferase [Actinomadura rudentiformis]